MTDHMLEIKIHDGPARQGKYQALETPNVLKIVKDLLVPDTPLPYDVPREMAEWSVKETLKSAEKGDVDRMAVIHGAKYQDLRLECARALEDMGYRLFLVANPEEPPGSVEDHHQSTGEHEPQLHPLLLLH